MNDIGWEHEKDMNESFFKREEKRKKKKPHVPKKDPYQRINDKYSL